MRSGGLFLVIGLLNLGLAACAHAQATLVRGGDLQKVSLEQALAGVRRGSIVVVGENHDLSTHQNQELQVMNQLRTQGFKVSVGLEFFAYPYQQSVEAYRAGQLPESDFLKQIHWGSDPFAFYRDQALFPRATEGANTVALNAPMSLTSQIAKAGLPSLTAEQAALLPPHFTPGRDSYRQRFLDLMGGSGHLPDPAAADRYFTAQSVWDDTMAWKATEFLAKHPDQILVIVVGEFHVQYGGGLPDRLRARGNFPVWTISLVNTEGLSESETQTEIQVSGRYGPRADYVWYGPAH